MKRLATIALLAAFACATPVARAETIGARPAAVADAVARRQVAPGPVDVLPGEAAGYAAREAAAPALAQFAGGGGGIYIGGSAVVVLLLVVIILLII